MESAKKIIKEHLQEYIDRSTDRTLAARIPGYAGFTREEIRGAVTSGFEALLKDLMEGTAEAHPGRARRLGVTRAQAGLPLNDVFLAMDIGFNLVSEHIKEVCAADL